MSPLAHAQTGPVSFSSLEEVRPQWQFYADGVDYFHARIAAPRLEFWALRVDLSENGRSRIFVSGGAAGSGESPSSGTVSTRVTSFVRDNDLLAGINALPFDISTPNEGVPIQNLGLVISNGILISNANPHYDALVFYKAQGGVSGAGSSPVRAAIVRQASIQSIENIENAVGGFYQILVNGEPAQRTYAMTERHPRSAAGLSANTDYLYLLVIDGRRTASIGATESETAAILRALGSSDGINFDGGGSSALALRYPDGRVRTANTPVHNNIPGLERAVAGSLGITR